MRKDVEMTTESFSRATLEFLLEEGVVNPDA